jgi:hypothetical protein
MIRRPTCVFLSENRGRTPMTLPCTSLLTVSSPVLCDPALHDAEADTCGS